MPGSPVVLAVGTSHICLFDCVHEQQIHTQQVDGRVGVVGSGQGMTEYESRNTFTKRKVMR